MPPDSGPPIDRLAHHAGSAVRALPISVKIIAALAIVLLPLGVVAFLAAVRSYMAVDSEQPITTPQALTIALPLLMWLAALATGWWVTAQLVVKPLTEMRRAIRRYHSGDADARLAARPYLSREMNELAEAFDAMADEIGRGEREVRTVLAEQRRLTREVHHRVKNNLQIVSSLLSIQSRDAPTPEVAAAYAAVQARVGALALVHRWMYGDDSARGVDLRALVTDLSANLEQSLTAIYRNPVHISCTIERVIIGEDTAVPIAFLITELLSVAAGRTAPEPLRAKITAGLHASKVSLCVAAPAFAEDMLLAGRADPATRIITGMARQLRSPIRHEPGSEHYVIDIALPAPEPLPPIA